MAYNYLELVNEICVHVNEVPLTEANFNTTQSFYETVKNGVNRAISEINTHQYFWRFNYTRQPVTLVVGQVRYTRPSDTKVIDFDSFLIKGSEVLNCNTRRLKPLDYDEFLQNYAHYEFEADTRREQPRFVVVTPGDDYILIPAPDKAYELVFDYYRQPVPLASALDVPTIPERYKYIIFSGVMRDVKEFREEGQEALMRQDKIFKDNIADVRALEINRFINIRSAVIEKGYDGNF